MDFTNVFVFDMIYYENVTKQQHLDDIFRR